MHGKITDFTDSLTETAIRTRAQKGRVGANYVALARLFSLSGRWYLPRHERLRIYFSGDPYKLRGDWGSLAEPAKPPDGMSPEQIAKARAYLETRGWTLVRNRKGGWHPQRTL